MINIQQLLCVVINFHVVKEALLYFAQDFSVNFWQLIVLTDLSLLINYSIVFQEHDPILLLSIQSGVHLIQLFNNRN